MIWIRRASFGGLSSDASDNFRCRVESVVECTREGLIEQRHQSRGEIPSTLEGTEKERSGASLQKK